MCEHIFIIITGAIEKKKRRKKRLKAEKIDWNIW